MIAASQPLPTQSPVGALRGLLGRDGWPALAGAAATVVVEVGFFLGAVACGVNGRQAAMASLAAGIVWVALAAPAMAAGASGGLGALVRGGVAADASAVWLIVLWLASPHVSLLAAVKIYCICAAVALSAVAAVRCAIAPAGRFALAAAASIVFMAALASPFWAGGAVLAAQAHRHAIVAAAVYANPFYCIWSVLADQMPYAWHQAPVMYRITQFGTYFAVPPVPWYAAAVIYAAAAGLLAATNLLRRDGGS